MFFLSKNCIKTNPKVPYTIFKSIHFDLKESILTWLYCFIPISRFVLSSVNRVQWLEASKYVSREVKSTRPKSNLSDPKSEDICSVKYARLSYLRMTLLYFILTNALLFQIYCIRNGCATKVSTEIYVCPVFWRIPMTDVTRILRHIWNRTRKVNV